MAHTVADALVICGVDNAQYFNGNTNAERISSEVFSDLFVTCMDMTNVELDDDWKTYAGLTVNQGQIRLRPGTKKNIRAFVQWTRDEIRLGRDPAATPFPVGNTQELLQRYITHSQWLKKMSDKAVTAKPKPFEEKTKWNDWKDTFKNFLRTQSGRNGVPLSYIIRKNDNPMGNTNFVDFLDDYINHAPLNGPAFTADSDEVHTYIVNFIAGNQIAENKLLPYMNNRNGRKDYMVLRDHFEGVVANAIAVLNAEKDIKDLFYSGEKKPHMWWESFELRMQVAYATIDNAEGRVVYSDVAKLRMLNDKISADFLQQARTTIDLDMARVPMTMTFDTALTIYRNAVQRKNPTSDAPRRRRRINETSSSSRGGRSSNGRGDNRGNRGGRGGRGGRNGRGSGRGRGSQTRGRSDAWFIQSTDGQRVEVHPSYRFSQDEWSKIPEEVKNQLFSMRQEYKRRRIQQTNSYHQPSQYTQYLPSYAPNHQFQLPPPPSL